MKRKIIVLFVVVLKLSTGISQEGPITTNIGKLAIKPATLVSSHFDFDNKDSGDVMNDGAFYFYGDYKNDGLFAFTTSQHTGNVVFEGENKVVQSIGGDSPSMFYNIKFNKSGADYSFELINDISSQGNVDFVDGIVLVNKQEGGGFLFLNGAAHTSTSDKSFVDGEVTKMGNEIFKYPIGNKKHYRYAKITAPKGIKETFSGQYIMEDDVFFKNHATKVGAIKEVNQKEYWMINKANNATSDVLLTLSWDDRTTPATLLMDPENELHIVRWDEHQQLWVDEGGVVDMSMKEVTTVSAVNGYGFFTLATVKKDLLNEGGVVIYNLVTPDGDGKNDYFIIENINKYPNNKVEIFNRWGVKVYEISGYDPSGDGSTNVFNGYSNGRVTIDKNKKLPSGTYYYVVTYEYTDSNGSRMIKKAANLHLETN